MVGGGPMVRDGDSRSVVVLAAASPPCNGWHDTQLDRMMQLMTKNLMKKR